MRSKDFDKVVKGFGQPVYPSSSPIGHPLGHHDSDYREILISARVRDVSSFQTGSMDGSKRLSKFGII